MLPLCPTPSGCLQGLCLELLLKGGSDGPRSFVHRRTVLRTGPPGPPGPSGLVTGGGGRGPWGSLQIRLWHRHAPLSCYRRQFICPGTLGTLARLGSCQSLELPLTEHQLNAVSVGLQTHVTGVSRCSSEASFISSPGETCVKCQLLGCAPEL